MKTDTGKRRKRIGIRIVSFLLIGCVFLGYGMPIGAVELEDAELPSVSKEVVELPSNDDELPEGLDEGRLSTDSDEDGLPAGSDEDGLPAGSDEDELPEDSDEDELPEDSEDDEFFEDEFDEDAYFAEASESLRNLAFQRPIMALVYLQDQYVVRSDSSEDSAPVTTVLSGQSVYIEDFKFDPEYGEIWIYVSYYQVGVLNYGYVQRTNLATSDERFLEWENQYGMNPQIMMFTVEEREITDPGIETFPESYHAYLYALKDAHPNWLFVKMDTNLDWETVVSNEIYGARSLVPSSFPSFMQTGSHSPGWAYASRDTLKYYLDPRNSLNEDYVFQFEQLTYNETYQTEAALQTFLNGTFMEGVLQEDQTYNTANGNPYTLTYTTLLFAVGRNENVSPYHLACRLKQEQGNGTSPLISGTYPDYQNLYNYFNIGASGTTNTEVIVNGLKKARTEGWTNRYLSIVGGTHFVASSYIARGQDTLYLQKFDVDNSDGSLYSHQYMQNICAPMSEGKNVRRIYNEAGSLENCFVFKVPVYRNMPETACVKPAVSYDVMITPPEGYTDPTIYLDGVPYAATSSAGKLLVSAENANAKTAVMYKYNETGVPTGMYIWTLSHNGQLYTATPQPGMEDLLTYHGFSIRIVGRSGIRFKTGISQSVRNQLTTTGINGYTLNEYGTLVMNHANSESYPFILGGQKVKKGVTYGTNENNEHVDLVYETVDGRYRYTSVLVGLPVEQYKTEFAFRGYIVLKKGNEEIKVYGPPVWRSIYFLANRFLASGQYSPDSSTGQFLKQIVDDADALEED